MNKTAIIAYTSNFFSQDQKPICYFLFQSMLANESSDRRHWFASIHPREDEGGVLDAAERLGLCVEGRLNAAERVLIIGGDLSGLAYLSSPLGVVGDQAEHMHALWTTSLAPELNRDVTFVADPLAVQAGVLWPKAKQSPPTQWQVVYVPELIDHEDMVWLANEVQNW